MKKGKGEREPHTYRFGTVRGQDLCVQFRADSFICSFGSATRFYKKDGSGSEEYLQWLRQRITEILNSCVHVWKEEQIIGQIEMMRCQHDSSVGYVNLFYLTENITV
ncbi:hypothetical protein [Nostoc sp. FACHB-888]|uniref:hypothetical protein n=1 Tax=Nostoc sp. FACHB-888 TaxID=2692842 RepID=UPI001689D486|nr:hypothetical protein [Nostoc sp. FACHB-888]MBD2249326.1 hypothetical protein [Nostoc sp. FACHB-888]